MDGLLSCWSGLNRVQTANHCSCLAHVRVVVVTSHGYAGGRGLLLHRVRDVGWLDSGLCGRCLLLLLVEWWLLVLDAHHSLLDFVGLAIGCW